MKITGELLKSERIKKDLTVQDIAYALKLNSKIIAAIENGQLDQLPAKTFVRGFVKSYADYLKIDSEVVLRQFQEEMGSTRPLPKRPPPIATDQVTTKKIEHAPQNEKITLETKFNKNHILAFVVVFILVLLIAIINNKITDYKNESLSSLNKISNPETVTQPVTPESTTSTTLQNQNATTAPAQLSENGTPTATTPSNGAAVPTDNASIEKTKPSAATTNQPAQPTTSYSSPTPSAGKPVELLIEAKKEITIEYAKGNSTQFTSIRMQPQTFQIIRSQAGLHLRTPDGSAVIITVNGVLKGSAASSATPTVLSY